MTSSVHFSNPNLRIHEKNLHNVKIRANTTTFWNMSHEKIIPKTVIKKNS